VAAKSATAVSATAKTPPARIHASSLPRGAPGQR